MELHHSAETEAPKKVTKLFLNRPLVLRVGRFGYDENFLDPDPDTSTPSRHADSFRVSHKASLFLYANQPVLPLLGAETLLYPSKSKGRTATLSIQRNR